MEEHGHATKNKPESKPGVKLDAKDDLKSLPMPEVENLFTLMPLTPYFLQGMFVGHTNKTL